MFIRHRRAWIIVVLASCFAVLFPARPAMASSGSAHLAWAQLLIDNVLPAYNAYGTQPSYVRWVGEGGATRFENRTECSNLLTHLFRQAYGMTSGDIAQWLGSGSPRAVTYHDAIEAQDGWFVIPKVHQIQPGDVLAIAYPEGLSASGHIAIARLAPVPRVATAPLVAGTSQYEIAIIDSTQNGHGQTDSRGFKESYHAGVGAGSMRLYTDAHGRIVGHTWSSENASKFYAQEERHAVVGRLNTAGLAPYFP
ncbi:hypothetical protein [Chondromyces apiculatus]|uniref:Peptidase C51 domain-containing protein n=1 Tax=Chondromyces apiculatus DSM 436 TaxID=1192034 RepID=A0A017T9M4_9BACT|nr:hypothetical protein [Chondromyces apiculatus]EYF05321.1 Hypothetical protein CAP_3462 [Chondromyces apiculatus DSM 436]